MDRYQRCIQLTAMTVCLTACMVGPDFHTPAAPNVHSYTESPLPQKTASTKAAGQAGKAQVYVYHQDIPAEWWQLFHSQAINDLVTTGLANSPNLASAQAALRQAQETFNQQVGNLLFPAFNGNFSGERQRFAGSSIDSPSSTNIFNLFNASVSVTYLLDVFGGSRRQLESLRAQVDYQQFQLIASYLSLTSNIVTTAFTIASLTEQIQATHELIQAQEAQLDIIRKQYQLGGVANTNVLTQQTLVEQTRATLPPLEKSLSQSRHALSVLVGHYPNVELPAIHLTALTLPKQIPVSLPSNLVRQRPDVRAAEALLHSASAQIGVATANLFPQFNLSAGFGWENNRLSSLIGPNTKTWNYGLTLTQPIFHGGALFAARRVAIAAYDQARAQYREVLLQAFQNVADTLRALETDARTLQAQKAAEMSAYQSLKLTQQQYVLGGVNYLNLLTAQQQYQQTRINRIQAEATRYADTAALFQALGGGWWNRNIAACGDPINPTHASMTCPA